MSYVCDFVDVCIYFENIIEGFVNWRFFVSNIFFRKNGINENESC